MRDQLLGGRKTDRRWSETDRASDLAAERQPNGRRREEPGS